MDANREQTERLLEEDRFVFITEEAGLEDYQAPFTTREQKERDRKITELLKTYVTAYKRKVFQSSVFRPLILLFCLAIIGGSAVALAMLPFQLLGGEDGPSVADAASFITACVSFLALVVSVLLIATKYFFPEDDEKYITRIVELIQQSDLENRRMNAQNHLELQKEAMRRTDRSDGPDSGAPGTNENGDKPENT